MSSLYGLNIVGYKRVTMVVTKSYEEVIRSKTLKTVVVRIVLLNLGA